jgi:hypothetical protein
VRAASIERIPFENSFPIAPNMRLEITVIIRESDTTV